MSVDLEGAARLAHSIYLNLMRDRGIPFYREFEQDARLWRKLAAMVHSAGMEMGTFMEAQFDIDDVRTLTIKKLTEKSGFADARRRYYRRVPKTSKEAYEDEFRMLMNQLLTLSHRLITRCYPNRNRLLRDFNMPFPAWFRILLADSNQEGYREVLRCFGELAKEEYETDQGLRLLLESLGGEYDAARFWQCI
jgi:hypothetical protein